MMELPSELVTAIGVLLTGYITKLVVDGFKSLSESFGFDVSKLATIIAAALSAFVVSVVIGVVNFGLGFVPPALAPVIGAVFTVLIGLFGAMGWHRQSKLARH